MSISVQSDTMLPQILNIGRLQENVVVCRTRKQTSHYRPGCAARGQAGGTMMFSQKALITKLVESAVSRQDGDKHPSNTTFFEPLAAKHALKKKSHICC